MHVGTHQKGLSVIADMDNGNYYVLYKAVTPYHTLLIFEQFCSVDVSRTC